MIKLITEEPIICKICDRECVNLGSLSQHLLQTHKINSLEYTHVYLLNNEIPKCKCGCGGEVNVKPFKYNEIIRFHNHTEKSNFMNNSENWKIECSNDDCSNIINYDNRDAYSGALKRIKKGYNQYCLDCRPKFRKVCGPAQIYTRNPDDWKWECEGNCGTTLIFKTKAGYVSALKRQKENIPVKCGSCCQKGRKLTEEQKIERNIKLKETWANKTPEELEQYSKNLSEAHKKRWENMTVEERIAFSYIMSDARMNMPEEDKKAMLEKISETRRKWHEKQSASENPTIKTFYNKDTIPFIVDILNVRYNTEFRHGESEKGEFKIYDKELKTLYCADAYSKELNLWIEFDERHHFRKGVLKEECQFREERIRKCIPNVTIHRIYFNIKHHNL